MKRKTFLKTITLGVISLGFVQNDLFATIKKVTDPINDLLCKNTWKKLCGKAADKVCYKYVGPQEGLSNVLIYGDSISQGYTEALRKQLKNEVSVFRIFKNGGASSTIIKNMNHLQETMFQPHLKGGWNFEWDLIQFNAGLHDIMYKIDGKYDVEKGTQVTSLTQYRKNLIEAITYFKNNHPKAKLIYTLTTPVPKDSRGRKEGDAVIFNKAALEVLENYPEIIVNDLYALTMPNIGIWAKKPGDVHYNTLGKTEQGKHVANIIKNTLNQ